MTSSGDAATRAAQDLARGRDRLVVSRESEQGPHWAAQSAGFAIASFDYTIQLIPPLDLAQYVFWMHHGVSVASLSQLCCRSNAWRLEVPGNYSYQSLSTSFTVQCAVINGDLGVQMRLN